MSDAHQTPSSVAAEPEPSIEDILAKVRRIVAEDERAEPVLTRAAAPVAASVLELTEVVAEEPPAVPEPAEGLGHRLEPPAPSHAAEPAANIEENAPMSGNPGKTDRLVSSPSSGAAAAAFAQLASVPQRRDGDVRLGAGERTLEDIVRDLLRPMLQAWLDEHLPAIVERLVRAEIARVVDEAGLR